MSSTLDCNTRSKEINDSTILDEISKLREELVKNFLKIFTDIKDEIINLIEAIIKNLQKKNYKRLNEVLNHLQEKKSVFNPRVTQLNNMADEITWRSSEFLIVFLMTTWNQLLSMYLVNLQMSM